VKANPWLFFVVLAACVPPGNSTPSDSGAATAASASATPAVRPSPNVMTAPFFDNFDRPNSPIGPPLPLDAGTDLGGSSRPLPSSAEARLVADAAPLPPDRALLDAAMRRDARAAGDAATDAAVATTTASEASVADPELEPIGPDWLVTLPSRRAWRIENGRLCGQNARNHGIWLKRTLPVNARIEYDATALSDEGDLKSEIWGDGASAATSTSYTNATSYLAIFGGWKNQYHVLARINEHGTDRKEIKIDASSDDPKEKPVVRGQQYHIKVERSDGKTVRMFVDDVEYLSYNDAAPLAGVGHDHMGFNEWTVKVCFDNVKVTPL
jgi:hypothetical protein